MAAVTLHPTGKFTCRFCGKTDFAIDIFSDHGRRMEICNKTVFSLGISLLETDKLPNYICYYCFGKLMDYYMFKQNVLLVQQRLTDGILKNKGNNNGVMVLNKNECIIDVTDDSPDKPKEYNGTANNAKSPRKEINSAVSPGPSAVPQPSTSTNNKRQNSSPTGASKKKDRKTVCLDCGKWLSRSEMVNHEATAHFRRNFDCLVCNAKFDSYLLYKKHDCVKISVKT